MNGLDNRNREIVLMNSKGRSWRLSLRRTKSRGRSYIHQGWREFCQSNGQKAGDFSRFKLVHNGTKPVLRLLSADSGNNNDNKSGEFSNKKKKKTPLIWRISSSSRENRFVTLTLSSYNLKKYKLRLPKAFARVNGLNKPRQQITLLDRNGREWLTNLQRDDKYGEVCFGKGWREFCAANEVKEGEMFTLELIWGDNTPTFKLCPKV